jgi:hypothetical protein
MFSFTSFKIVKAVTWLVAIALGSTGLETSQSKMPVFIHDGGSALEIIVEKIKSS